jgi:hypothetical protein
VASIHCIQVGQDVVLRINVEVHLGAELEGHRAIFGFDILSAARDRTWQAGMM